VPLGANKKLAAGIRALQKLVAIIDGARRTVGRRDSKDKRLPVEDNLKVAISADAS
jgi:hypothetical protein